MTKSCIIPDSDLSRVREMALTMTDEQIAARYNCSTTTVWKFRSRHGIKASHQRGYNHKPAKPIPQMQQYTDPDGLTVTLCPSRYAAGIILQPTVRPSGWR